MESATQAAQALYETRCSRQGSEEDHHRGRSGTAGVHLGYWKQSGNGRQAASRLTATKDKNIPKNEKQKILTYEQFTHLEHRASSSQGKHEGESSLGLCDRLDRTRDNSQRQLPTDHDYAVPTREYQTDQSSPFLPWLLLALYSGKQRQQQKQHLRWRRLTRSLHIRQMYSSAGRPESIVPRGASTIRYQLAHKRMHTSAPN